MKTTSVHILIYLVICFLFSTSANVDAQSGALAMYAYAIQKQAGEIRINLIDPSRADSVADILTLPISSELSLNSAIASPNGKWAVLVFDKENAAIQLIQIIDFATAQLKDVTELTLQVYSSQLDPKPQPIVWSPDSRYLAFNVWSIDNDKLDTYLYDVESSLLVNLTSDTVYQYQLAWSYDSQYLAVFSGDCLIGCQRRIEIYDIATRHLSTSFDITKETLNFSLATETALCQLDWSPNGAYLSFVMGCDASAIPSWNEIYVLSLSGGTLYQLSSFTNAPDSQAPHAEYKPIWYNKDILLVGVSAGSTQVTVAYNLLNKSENLISTILLSDWALNPVMSSLVAYRTVSSVDSSSDAVQIATCDDMILNILASNNPPGIKLIWSPDGNTLAYRTTGLPGCGACEKGIAFIDSTSKQLIGEHLLPHDPPIVIPIGWVLVSNAE